MHNCVRIVSHDTVMTGNDHIDKTEKLSGTSFTQEVNPLLANRPLVFKGRLANLGLTP